MQQEWLCALIVYHDLRYVCIYTIIHNIIIYIHTHMMYICKHACTMLVLWQRIQYIHMCSIQIHTCIIHIHVRTYVCVLHFLNIDLCMCISLSVILADIDLNAAALVTCSVSCDSMLTMYVHVYHSQYVSWLVNIWSMLGFTTLADALVHHVSMHKPTYIH